MLAWLRERVAAAPDGIHGVIVPDLDAHRGSLERALAAALQPDLELPAADRDDRVFDLAGGHPLIAQPVVDAALASLACAAGTVDWATASRLLLSRHLAGAASRARRAHRRRPRTARAAGRRARAGSLARRVVDAGRCRAVRVRGSVPQSRRSRGHAAAPQRPGRPRSAAALLRGAGPATRHSAAASSRPRIDWGNCCANSRRSVAWRLTSTASRRSRNCGDSRRRRSSRRAASLPSSCSTVTTIPACSSTASGSQD